MKREALEDLLTQAKTLNKELEKKDSFDLNEVLSYLYRQGLIKALSNKDAKYGRVEEVYKKLAKLEKKFLGFQTEADLVTDTYKNLTFYNDVKVVGELLGYELGSDQFTKKYDKLAHLPFPMYFGWLSQNVLVYMKDEPTTNGYTLEGNIKDLVNILPDQVPGAPSQFKLDPTNLDSNLKGSMLIFFAEKAMPRDTQVALVKELVEKIAESVPTTQPAS